MATIAEITAAITPIAEIAPDAVPILANLWHGELLTADPAVVQDFARGRLANPHYAGFKRPTEAASPATTTTPEQPQGQTWLQRNAEQFRESQIRNRSLGLGLTNVTPEDQSRVAQADQAAAQAAATARAAQEAKYQGMSWLDRNVAQYHETQAATRSLGLYPVPEVKK